MKLRVLNDFVLVKPNEEEFVSDNMEITRILNEGKIHIPEKFVGFFKKTPMRGEVVSCGSSCHKKFVTGSKVIFARFAGAPFNWEETKYRFLKEEDIIAEEVPDDQS